MIRHIVNAVWLEKLSTHEKNTIGNSLKFGYLISGMKFDILMQFTKEIWNKKKLNNPYPCSAKRHILSRLLEFYLVLAKRRPDFPLVLTKRLLTLYWLLAKSLLGLCALLTKSTWPLLVSCEALFSLT